MIGTSVIKELRQALFSGQRKGFTRSKQYIFSGNLNLISQMYEKNHNKNSSSGVLFCKSSWRTLAVKYFRKKIFHHSCLFDSVLNAPLSSGKARCKKNSLNLCKSNDH